MRRTSESWDFPTLIMSQDKSMNRLGVNPGSAAELVGWDGRLHGGLRPHYGYKEVHQIAAQDGEYNSGWDVAAEFSGGVAIGMEAVYNYEPISFRVGTSGFAVGHVVYGVLSGEGPAPRLFFEFFYDGEWYYVETSYSVGASSLPLELDVVVYGRLVYLLVKGEGPYLLFYDTTLNDFVLQEDTDLGPGEKPTLRPTAEGGSAGDLGEATENRVWYLGILGSGLQLADRPDSFTISNASLAFPGTATPQYVFDIQTEGLLRPGNYSFAFRLYNSQTGRYSQLSEAVSWKEDSFDNSGQDPSYFAFEIIYDSTIWTHAFIYRSVDSDSAGGTLTNSILFQEAFIDLTLHTPTNGATYLLTGDDKRAVFWVALPDEQLVHQSIYNNTAYFDERVPKAGCGVLYDGTMLLSQIEGGTAFDEAYQITSGVGEVRWSALTERSVELFPPNNRYVPNNPTDVPIRFHKVGDRVFGFGVSQQYMVYKTQGYLALREMHQGYGIVGKHASTVVANGIYMVSHKGIMMVDAQGDLDGIRSLDYLIMEEWKADLDTNCAIQMAFDSVSGCISVLNRVQGEMACMWMTTSMVTEMEGITFRWIKTGLPPNSTTSEKSPARALFVLNDGRVFIEDVNRTKDLRTLIDIPSGTDVNITLASGTGNQIIAEVGTTLHADMLNTNLVFTSGAYEGESYTILGVDVGTRTLTLSGTLSGSVTAGDTIAVSPVRTRVVCGAIGTPNQQGFSIGATELFNLKQVTSIGCYFENVSGDGTSSVNAKFKGLVYVGLNPGDEAPTIKGSKPLSVDGDPITSLEEGASLNYSAVSGEYGAYNNLLFPGVEVICSDVDFLLLGFRVNGHVLNRSRMAGAE